MKTPPPGSMQTPIPGVPGAVPIVPMSSGTLVSSSMSNQPPMATQPPRSTPMSTVALPLPPPSAQTPHGVPLATSPGAPPDSPVPVTVSYAQADVTERVRVPRRASSDTSHVRVPGRSSPIVWIAGLLVVAGGITAVIALRGGKSPAVNSTASTTHMATTPPTAVETPPPAAAETTPPSAVPTPSAAATAPAASTTPVAEAPAQPEPTVPTETKPADTEPAATKPVEAKPVASKPVEAKHVASAKPVDDDKPEPPKRSRSVAKPPAKIVKKAAKPDKKPEPKETKSWNADSPFMPVRTDKH